MKCSTYTSKFSDFKFQMKTKQNKQINSFENQLQRSDKKKQQQHKHDSENFGRRTQTLITQNRTFEGFFA